MVGRRYFYPGPGEGSRDPGRVAMCQEAGCACKVEISSELGDRKPSLGVTGRMELRCCSTEPKELGTFS